MGSRKRRVYGGAAVFGAGALAPAPNQRARRRHRAAWPFVRALRARRPPEGARVLPAAKQPRVNVPADS